MVFVFNEDGSFVGSETVAGYSNMIGTYRLTAEGALADVSLLFDDLKDPKAIGTTIDLGTPAMGESIGFFLIQDGHTLYDTLPDDLSFIWLGGAWTLHSDSQGDLTQAAVFHSVAAFNPDGAVQVLSGVQAGGDALWIGFEDMAGDAADYDFQDIVLTLRESDALIG